jgi:hypothetical protein
MISLSGSIALSMETKRWRPFPGVTTLPDVTLETELWNEIQVGSLSTPVTVSKKKIDPGYGDRFDTPKCQKNTSGTNHPC